MENNSMNHDKDNTHLKIIELDPKILVEHPAAGPLPAGTDSENAMLLESMQVQGYDRRQPVELLEDQITILHGRRRKRAAIQAGFERIPCVIRVVSDPFAEMCRDALTRGNLHSDQYAYVAWLYRNHLSRLRKTERAKKGGRPPRAGKDKPTLAEPAVEKLDSRRDAARTYQVPQNKLKNLDLIQEWEREKKIPKAQSKMPRIRDGVAQIGQVCAQIRAAKKAVARAVRLEAAKGLAEMVGWRHGECVQVLRDMDESKQVRLLVLDPEEPGEMEQLLKLAPRFMSPAGSVIVFSTFGSEPLARRILDSANYSNQRRLIWDWGKPAGATNLGGRHRSLIWAARDGVDLMDSCECPPSSDVLAFAPAPCKDHPAEKPVELMRALIQLATLPNELVLDPYGGIATSYIAARQTGRKILAIEGSEDYYRLGQERIDTVFAAPKRLDAQITAAIGSHGNIDMADAVGALLQESPAVQADAVGGLR